LAHEDFHVTFTPIHSKNDVKTYQSLLDDARERQKTAVRGSQTASRKLDKAVNRLRRAVSEYDNCEEKRISAESQVGVLRAVLTESGVCRFFGCLRVR
jgi:iron uptake system EfeUOB component EfeO/EfeM